MARRKTTRKRRATASVASRPRSARRRRKGSDKIANFVVPLFLMICIVSVLGIVLFLGFQTVAASSFFEVENIEIDGVRNVSRKKVESIVRTATGRGVWEADLEEIRNNVSRIEYIRHVSVSRILPGTIRVIVDERKPVALVRTGGKIYRVDQDATLLETVSARITGQPFLILGWDSGTTRKSREDNQKRIDLYLKLREEWEKFDVAHRVIAVDMSNLRSIEAVILDSGKNVSLSLGNENFGERLKAGIGHASGKGERVSKIILDGPSPVIVYRD